MGGAYLHNVDFFLEALGGTLCSGAFLILLELSQATSRHKVMSLLDCLGVLAVRLMETSLCNSQRLTLSVWKPVIMRLNHLMVFVCVIIKVSVHPGGLWHDSHVEGSVRDSISRSIVESLSDRVVFLVSVRVDDLVEEIIVGLLPIVFWEP
jgi:hypothetical protein